MRRPRPMVVMLGAILVLPALVDAQRAQTIPGRLTDHEFWALSESLSEPPATFQSDNLVSNEGGFQTILPGLSERHPAGGVYIGVGPEQNLTYIAALRPRIAFIIDIRGENRGLHLLYKALFELAANRAEFVSLLFSRPMPASITDASTAAELFAAINPSPGTDARFNANIRRVFGLLRVTHKLDLSPTDADSLEHAYRKFARSGPAVSYSTNQFLAADASTPSAMPSYGCLMQESDASGEHASYLASEVRFRVVKDLEARNLIIPVIGDFAGPRAIRAVGDWLRARQTSVSVFYVSNVEQYLEGTMWTTFCRSVATLPVEEQGEFVRSGPALHFDQANRLPMRIAYSPDRRNTVLTYRDGTSRQIPTVEFDKAARVPFHQYATKTALIAEDIKACKRP